MITNIIQNDYDAEAMEGTTHLVFYAHKNGLSTYFISVDGGVTPTTIRALEGIIAEQTGRENVMVVSFSRFDGNDNGDG